MITYTIPLYYPYDSDKGDQPLTPKESPAITANKIRLQLMRLYTSYGPENIDVIWEEFQSFVEAKIHEQRHLAIENQLNKTALLKDTNLRLRRQIDITEKQLNRQGRKYQQLLEYKGLDALREPGVYYQDDPY